MFRRGVPVIFRDPQSLMRRLHVAARVDAWSARGRAELIDDVLANALLRVVAGAFEEFREAVIGYQATNEIVNDRSYCIVATKTIVEGLLVLRRAHRVLSRHGDSHCAQNAERQRHLLYSL